MLNKRYEAFAAVVDHGSFTLAAEALGYTQSGVSHMISGPEAELGLTLLRRSRTGVRLTPEGERVLDAVREVLAAEEGLCRTVDGLKKPNAGVIRICAFTSVAVHWLPGMIKSFRQAYPGVRFKLLNGDYHDVDSWLKSAAVDLGFVALPYDGCACVKLTDDELLAIVPREHPLAQYERIPVERMAGEPFISLLESSDHDARRALEAAGVRPNVLFTTKDDYAIIAMVEQGLGVSIMPRLLLRGRSDRVAARPLLPGAKRSIALAIPDRDGASPAVRSFIPFVEDWVRRDGGQPC